jgi:TolB protein
VRTSIALPLLAMLVGACTGPAGAPEGRLLVTGTDGSVVVTDLTGADPVVVGEASSAPVSVQPTPAPAGTPVAFTTVDDEGTNQTGVWDGSEVTLVEMPFAPFYYQWDPSGTRFAALGNAATGVGGVVVDATTGEVSDIGSATPFFLDWAPGGERLAAFLDGGRVVTIVPGEDASRLELSPAVFQAPEWIDDALVVVPLVGSAAEATLQEDGSSTATVAVVDVETGATLDLLEVGGPVGFTASNDRLAVLEGRFGGPLVGSVVVVPTGGGDPITVVAEGAITAEWSPDGDLLLLGLLRTGSDEIHPAVWDGSELVEFPGYRPTPVTVGQYLPFWGQYARSTTTWSPRSDAFAYAAVDGDREVVQIQRLSSQEPEPAGEGSYVSWLAG